jgi:predicted nucleic acid-binding protein
MVMYIQRAMPCAAPKSVYPKIRRQHARSHGTELPDALIAACADNVGARLVTHNRKRFPMLRDVVVPY